MKQIKSALISVYHKDGLAPIVAELQKQGVTIYSTGGTQSFIEGLGAAVTAVEDVTTYPSILDGRVKTLHPKVFGGILARREAAHLDTLVQYEIPEIDLVICDLYPFEATVASTNDEPTIIEKIDIGGISLIRAAAKNYRDVVIVPSMDDYDFFLDVLKAKGGTELADRKELARRAFKVSSNYDTAIFNYFDKESEDDTFKHSLHQSESLRYGENPHQKANFYGDLTKMFDILNGKQLSYNNLVDIDAAVGLMTEFKDDKPTFAVLKHTNPCGVATRDTVAEAWEAALAGDNVSAFGGILITNTKVDLETAKAIDKIFYEVLIATAYDADALAYLKTAKKANKNRRILVIKEFKVADKLFKTCLSGVLEHDADKKMEMATDMNTVTKAAPTTAQLSDLVFANRCVKHLKSNTIVLVKNNQLIGMGCGQTSRIDACNQAIAKAGKFGFDVKGSVMASDAFFPFPDCVEVAHGAGVEAVVQPGGSIKDNLSIAYCDEHGLPMVMTGTRHFKH